MSERHRVTAKADSADPDQRTRTSSSGSVKSRYKPLAPKQTSGGRASDGQGSGIERPQAPARTELTFFNVTNPAQSKSQENRRLVRTQVMKNFAKEKKRQKSEGESVSREPVPSLATADSLRNIQQLFSQASIGPSPVTTSPQAMPDPTQAQVSPRVSASNAVLSQTTSRGGSRPRLPNRKASQPGPDSPLGLGMTQWPLDLDPPTYDLMRHCHSPAFRATNPLYMISILTQRPTAAQFPFGIDIDADDPGDVDQTIQSIRQNEIFQLAGQFPALSHAICMIAASDLALRQVNKALNDQLVIHHRSKALLLLNQAIEKLTQPLWPATVATIAVLASHELIMGDYKAWTIHVLGLSRLLEMQGGLSSLGPENLTRRLIVWSDEIGALLMMMKPFFSLSDVLVADHRASHIISPQSAVRYQLNQPPDEVFQRLLQDNIISRELFEVVEDIACVARVGGANIVDAVDPPIKGTVIEVRDSILRRLIYLASGTQEGEDDLSLGECVRLALLLLTMGRLFSPTLPSAYFQISHMVADRLAGALEPVCMMEECRGHEQMALWICLVGTSVSSNNPATWNVFISSAAHVCRQLFGGPHEMGTTLAAGLAGVTGNGTLYSPNEVMAFVEHVQVQFTQETD